jgi:hypothetical protein
MHVRGNLQLDDGGWSSGGFISDSVIDGQIRSGSQQQWLTRNSREGSWSGSNWNMVFVGVQGAPGNSFPNPPYTTVASAPVVREKPFLYVDGAGAYNVFVPATADERDRADLVRYDAGRYFAAAEPVPDHPAGRLGGDDELGAGGGQEPARHAGRLPPQPDPERDPPGHRHPRSSAWPRSFLTTASPR